MLYINAKNATPPPSPSWGFLETLTKYMVCALPSPPPPHTQWVGSPREIMDPLPVTTSRRGFCWLLNLQNFELETRSLTHSASNIFNSNPPERKHCGVMVSMQEGDLVVLLSQYEEYCVKEFDKFGDVIPP